MSRTLVRRRELGNPIKNITGPMNSDNEAPQNLFATGAKTIIGMVHLLPLPGSEGYGGIGISAITQRAVAEARVLAEGGVDAILIQNSGDEPWTLHGGPETIAYMSVIGAMIRQSVRCAVGVNILANGAVEALAVAQTEKAAATCDAYSFVYKRACHTKFSPWFKVSA